MSIVVNNNNASLVAQRNLTTNINALKKSFERLSSGTRINSASDDAAGLSISETLRGQIRGNDQAIKNTQDGINMLQIAEGSLAVIGENLQRIRELCVQAANATYATLERQAIIDEINQRTEDITRLSKASNFNKIQLLDGTATSLKLQIGPGTVTSTNVLDIKPALPDAQASTLGIVLSATGDTWTPDNIRSYLDNVDNALKSVVSKRSTIGAYQTRLESALDNLTVMNENIRASESRIRDVDIAKETAEMTKNQILQQASTSVLKQANQLPAMALSLLG